MIHPALDPRRPTLALQRAQLAQHARLAVGVSGVTGGLVLLGANTLYLIIANVAVVPWTPLLANAALIFGGTMFLREYRRRRPARRDGSTE